MTTIVCCKLEQINKILLVVLDETEHGFGSEYAFIYSDIMVNISQVTPVTIQNKNHLEIIQIRTQIKLVIW